jgi:hypothetical protein
MAESGRRILLLRIKRDRDGFFELRIVALTHQRWVRPSA